MGSVVVEEEEGCTHDQRGEEKHINGNGEERRDIGVFSDGETVAFEGAGPHFGEVK
jgi:hypothetical protein